MRRRKKKVVHTNLNEVARLVSFYEGGKQNLSIAQIKETMSCLGMVLAGYKPEDALQVIAKMIKNGKK